jgi:protein-S-isoprenylcysteine O-methyltransferase Ste14
MRTSRSDRTGDWYTLLGLKGHPHTNPIHIASYLVIALGFLLLAKSWRVLYAAQRDKKLATTGPYAHVRHPQYDGFLLIMIGFLLQWPTLVTLVMFPVLVATYVRLAHKEELEVARQFGDDWGAYATRTPGRLWRSRSSAGRLGSSHT